MVQVHQQLRRRYFDDGSAAGIEGNDNNGQIVLPTRIRRKQIRWKYKDNPDSPTVGDKITPKSINQPEFALLT